MKNYLILSFLIISTISFGQKPKLKAEANETTECSTIIDEKDIRKLNELIYKRINEAADSNFIDYKVLFSNNSFYETSDFNYIFQEENPLTRRIEEISITAKDIDISSLSGDSPMIYLSLGNKKITYRIQGGNRDWVLNTQTDIKERIEILNQKQYFTSKFKIYFQIFFAIISFVILWIIIAIFLRRRYIKKSLKEGKREPNIGLLKYTFDYFLGGKIPDGFLFYLMIFSIGGFAYLIGEVISKLYPEHIFLIGEEIERYRNIVELRGTITNTIVIGLIVSTAAGFIVHLLTSNKNKPAENF